MSWVDEIYGKKIISCGWAGGPLGGHPSGGGDLKEGMACAFIILEGGRRLNVLPDDEETREVMIKVTATTSRELSRVLEDVVERGGTYEFKED